MDTKLKDESDVSGDQEAIKTFAFFDLETTGLPDLEFFQTKITELSVVAVAVNHLTLGANDTPRVQHKLTLCFNPFKRIDLKASEVTGLDNELLEFQNKFDANAMKLLECFLLHLPQPVCLIAHNGDKFDFPLIKKQYDIFNGNFPDSVKCCDSLPIFRKIESLTAKKVEKLNKASLKMWKEALDDGFIINAELENILDNGFSQPDKPDELFQQLEENEIEEIEKLEQENKKPNVDDLKLRQAINEQTPDKTTKSMNLHPNFDQQNSEQRKIAGNSKRELFPSTSTKTQQTKGKFTLREIYKRFYGSHPENAHDAESDVVSLMKCVIACKEDFVRIVNENCIEFKNVKRF